MTIEEIVALLPDAKPTSNGWQARCPAHDDKKASLCIHQESDGKILMMCQAGCDTRNVMTKLGLSWQDMFPMGSEPNNRPAKRSASKRRNFAANKKIVATYDYVNENGELLYQVQRTDTKEFIQRHRVIRDNVAKWEYNIKGVARVLYRLPRLKAAISEGQPIYIVEGEKDVHTLESWGLIATTSSGGAMAKWTEIFSKSLAGANVIILPDNDDPGKKHAEDVGQSLLGTAGRVRVICLPDIKEHGDVSDWAAAGGTPVELAHLVDAAEDFTPGSIHTVYVTPRGVSRIDVANVPLREIGRSAIRALISTNNPPYLFLRGGSIVRYRETELSQPLVEKVNDAIMGSRLADVADFILETQEMERQMNPSKDVIRYVMSDPSLSFPKLIGVTESPMLRSDGSILSAPGYDSLTGYYYKPPDGFVMPDIPEHPTGDQVSDAVELILEAICDFPFVDDASRTNTVALMLTPLVRNIVPTAPIALIDATNQGTGKTLLSEVCGTISCGTYELGTVPIDNDEWRKRITSLLSEGARCVILDNVRGVLGSDSLASVLTTSRWSDRRLGTLETASYPNNATWVATGNNLQMDGDMSRRGFLIELDAKCARPFARECDFKHPDLLEWVNLNRGELLAALFTIIRAWYSAGQPGAAIPPMGSFESWSRVIGGIISHCGLPAFNANRDKLLSDSDTESSGWERFLCRWIELYGDTPKTVAQIKSDLVAADGFENVLPDALSHAVKGGTINPSKVGRAFRAREGTRFGDTGVHLRRAGVDHQAVLWTVGRSVTSNSGELGEHGEVIPSESIRESNIHDTCTCTHACNSIVENAPQAPLPPQTETKTIVSDNGTRIDVSNDDGLNWSNGAAL